MDINKLRGLLDKLSPGTDLPTNMSKHSRTLILDGMNTFLRCFAAINHLSPNGSHVGGVGGFLRSLGFLTQKIKPTSIYIIFDGIGSSVNRKYIYSEYKSNRNINQITNWDAFNNVEEELDSKVLQIGRLINYLECLPVKIVSMDKVEADDVIAYISSNIIEEDNKNQVYIVSSDKDFLQLASKNVIIYRPQEKQFWDGDSVIKNFDILPRNFILYKTLVGDQSDKIPGVKGLGKKKILKYFPELSNVELSLKDIYEISSKKYKENLIYAKVILEYSNLEKYYQIMDLVNPLLDDNQIEFLNQLIGEDVNKINIELFITMYNDDGIGRLIQDPQFWIRSTFNYLYNFNNNI